MDACDFIFFLLPSPDPLLSSFFCAAPARGVCLILVYTRSSCCYTLCLFCFLSHKHIGTSTVFSVSLGGHIQWCLGMWMRKKEKGKKNFPESDMKVLKDLFFFVSVFVFLKDVIEYDLIFLSGDQHLCILLPSMWSQYNFCQEWGREQALFSRVFPAPCGLLLWVSCFPRGLYCSSILDTGSRLPFHALD